jgi:hypothetical protein
VPHLPEDAVTLAVLQESTAARQAKETRARDRFEVVNQSLDHAREAIVQALLQAQQTHRQDILANAQKYKDSHHSYEQVLMGILPTAGNPSASVASKGGATCAVNAALGSPLCLSDNFGSPAPFTPTTVHAGKKASSTVSKKAASSTASKKRSGLKPPLHPDGLKVHSVPSTKRRKIDDSMVPTTQGLLIVSSTGDVMQAPRELAEGFRFATMARTYVSTLRTDGTLCAVAMEHVSNPLPETKAATRWALWNLSPTTRFAASPPKKNNFVTIELGSAKDRPIKVVDLAAREHRTYALREDGPS